MINPRIQNDDVKTSALIFIKMDAFCLEAIDPLINIPHHDAVRCVQLVPHDHLDHSNAGGCDKTEKICLVYRFKID